MVLVSEDSGREEAEGRREGGTVLQESMKTGSESFTIGKCRRLPA